MAKYPIRIDISKTKPAAAKATSRAAPPITQATLDRAARVQREEAGESVLARRPAAKDVISVTTRMRETPAKKGR